MREIKCRGYDDFDKEWIYGAYWYDSAVSDSFIIPYGRQATQVNQDTIGQSTGLNDKNKVEIYEGDIAVLRGWIKGIVFLNQSANKAAWNLKDIDNGNIITNIWDLDYFEVIGNIHERS